MLLMKFKGNISLFVNQPKKSLFPGLISGINPRQISDQGQVYRPSTHTLIALIFQSSL
jgi:hypothetical protein